MPATDEAARLAPEQWRAREARHHERTDSLLADHLRRRSAGVAHPVEDFLFSYYSHKPAHLRRWHPGPGTVLLDAPPERTRERWHREVRTCDAEPPGAVLDTGAFLERRGPTVEFVAALLRATNSRPAHLGCFGLHEWAMVYRLGPEDVRHASVPLRLGAEGTDRVVDTHTIRCSHYDAYRFFTPEAHGRNRLRPTREGQPEQEQPGCLHAGMDVYKWAYKLAPAVPGELVLDSFELARDIRALDMRASPYELRAYGYDPVPIETPEGKAAYIEAQRGFTERAKGLRERLLRVCDALLGTAPHNAVRPEPGAA
ncbi:hypothetical protein CLV63_12753 [Murinocardiopsis flavida]|uniref:3-methyladenine DNA glycosylase n=2 Tax=Murinocardiopsis flavida TaxID=645275 RepID=A0A2P8CW56_9ACTN|nr:3-methyladenine DNA glycosylase [Murinocardiopsis flavida]PSK89180.1 hypothetical protein CLV63_12753 [Murinocardiopsis flavida]